MGGIEQLAETVATDMEQRLPGQRKTQRGKLALLVATMLQVRSANLMDVAACLPRPAERLASRYQWIKRFLANARVVSDAVMAPSGREVLARLSAQGQTVVLLIDQTKVSERHQVVMVAVRLAQFDRGQERLAYNRSMARRNNGVHAYLLRGLVSCGHCRRACGGRHLRPGYDYYVCPTKTQRRALVAQERCRARYIPARQLEDLVWRDLCQVLQHPQMIATAMERARGGHWLPQELQARRATLRRGRAALGQQRDRLTEAYLSGVIPLGEYERRRREIEARLAGLERQEQQLAAEAARDGETAKLAGHVETFCRRVQEGLAVADLAGKRGLLELLVDRVVVTDGAVEIRYALPTGPNGEHEPFCRLRSDYRGSVPSGQERRSGGVELPTLRGRTGN